MALVLHSDCALTVAAGKLRRRDNARLGVLKARPEQCKKKSEKKKNELSLTHF